MNGINSPPLKIERAGVASGALLAALHDAAFFRPGDETWTERSFSDVLNSPGSFCLLALDMSSEKQEPCGFLACRVRAQEAELLSIGVIPSFQRQGVASQLIEQSIRRCRDTGARNLFLEVAEDNPSALGLYAGKGFDQVGVRKNYYHRLDNVLVNARTMCLSLIMG